MEAWQDTWTVVFWLASALFYGTVTVVALRGMGDVATMVRRMITARRQQSAPPGE